MTRPQAFLLAILVIVVATILAVLFPPPSDISSTAAGYDVRHRGSDSTASYRMERTRRILTMSIILKAARAIVPDGSN